MKPHLPSLLLAALLAAPVRSAERPAAGFRVWRLVDERCEPNPGADDAFMLVGSLQKPFIVQAWAAAHPDALPPRFTCPPGPGCWDHRGHGELGLARALALSCNAYFRELAAATPPAALERSFREAGFLGAPAGPDAAIGRRVDANPAVIRPSDLLRAYRGLIRTPWPSGEEARQALLAGLREAARTGTAGSLGGRPCWAKTGTVPLDDLRTAGLALLVDDAGHAALGRLEPGTGREAAARLAAWIGSAPGAPISTEEAAGSVTVRVLELLRGRRVVLRNAGPVPLPGPHGFLGPGAKVVLGPGEAVGPGRLEIQEPRSGLLRRVSGRLACHGGPGGGSFLVLACRAQDYVAGVLAAELANPVDPRRIELGAATLRFLAKGPRHPEADVCDSTHCAWFVGLGPALRWDSPGDAKIPSDDADLPGMDGPQWETMKALARRPGPARWTNHCGGRPLSEQALWGSGETKAPFCPRHYGGQSRPWTRNWRAADLEKAFDGPVEGLSIGEQDGMWVLRVAAARGTRSFNYDEAHRRLARILGWGAMPSPADSVAIVPGGFQARGVGLGHRVGLCLGE